jgi:hypothetical protein
MALPAVVIPLFDRPIRTSLHIGRDTRAEQLQALADIVRKHLLDLAPVVAVLKRAGWEILAQETALVCRHPSVRTRLMAEVALSQLEIESQWFRIYDPAQIDELFPKLGQNGSAIPATSVAKDGDGSRTTSALTR